MRDVCVFLAPAIFEANSHLVDGLEKNEIRVSCFNVAQENYAQAVAHHQALLNEKCQRELTSPRLCIAVEDTREGVVGARVAGLTVVAIGQNRIDLDRFASWGAHAVALSVSELLESFGIRNYYQIQYLPYCVHLRLLGARKVGYPFSMLDSLSGSVKQESIPRLDTLRGNIIKNEQDLEMDDATDDLVELDPTRGRIIPREVLGIKHGSLADVYINNIGMPRDRIKTFHMHTHELEEDIIRLFAKFYQVEPDTALTGFMTSGGTEGNFCGLWWARDYLKTASGGHPPILLTSNLSHYSVSKVAHQLDLDGRLVQTNREGEMDCNDLAQMLDDIARNEPKRPILMQVNFGTTQTGALDSLPDIYRLLMEKVKSRGVLFSIHVDAALMGAVVPITQPFGNVNLFQEYGVNTMAISGHKFFGSVCICGVFLATTEFQEACFAKKETQVKYLTGLHDMTPSGSRSGFNILSFHNTLCGVYMHTNANRLRQIVKQCYLNVEYFLDGLIQLIGPDQVIHAPNSLTICFTPPPSDQVMDRYTVMPVVLPNSPTIPYTGVCVLVNVTRTHIDKFLKEYARDLRRNERTAESFPNKITAPTGTSNLNGLLSSYPSGQA